MIIDPDINTKVLDRITYECDTCSKKTEIQFKAWLQRRGINSRIWKSDFDKHKNKKDACPSCTVSEIHSNRSDEERSTIAKKGAPARSKRCREKHEHLHSCWVCGAEFKRKNKNSKKMCRSCLDKFGGKDWMSKIPQDVLNNKIKPRMRERMLGKNNIMYGKVGCHGKVTKLNLGEKTFSFRSKWEAAFAVYLHKCGYKINYETETFEINNNFTYTPDFIIQEEEVVVEVKGFWRDDAYEKWNLFCKKYSNLNPILFDSKKMKEVLGFNPKNKKKLNEYIEPFISGKG